MQIIKTFCDICKKEGSRFPSWFSIEREPIGTKSMGIGNLMETVYENPKVNYIGYARYEKWVDLCSEHRDEIIKAIQDIIDKKPALAERKL